jgi:xanthine dehydrogenase iron-sulfur cluster and FAD-binding subunit A
MAGNIATASPIGDSLPLLLSLDASIFIESFNKKIVLPLKIFLLVIEKLN